MNKLTINRIALGSINRRRSKYATMIFSAGLAIFFVSSLFLIAQSVYETDRLAHIAHMGNQDAILLDAEDATPEALLHSGMVAEVGSIHVIGETANSHCAIGYYDNMGSMMAARQVTEGRLPEKVGEIAVEPNFLQKQRSKAKVGDNIDLSLRIPHDHDDFLHDTINKTYLIVGIIKPQSIYLEQGFASSSGYHTYPSAIVSANELVEPGGRNIVHRLVMLARGVSLESLAKFVDEEYMVVPIPTTFSLFRNDEHSGEFDYNGQLMIMIAGFLGVVLLLTACQGIINVFSSNLSERRNQIGMMRAVGSTSRQIRRIFGREAFLLALSVSPISIGLSYLFVWGLTTLTGVFTFFANPWFIPLDLFASLTCVMLASWVPLIGVSKLPPMQAIRDVSLLRARRRIKVREKSHYSAPLLIAVRYLRLYRTRQAGIAVIIALSMLMISVALPFAYNLWSITSPYGYQIIGKCDSKSMYIETNMTANKGLTDADVAEALALPQVSELDLGVFAQVNMLVDQVTPYADVLNWNDLWLNIANPPEASIRAQYLRFKAAQQLTKDALRTDLYGFDDECLTTLSPYVLEGSINLDALKTGREVLVIAPKEFYINNLNGDNQRSFKPFKDMTNAITYANDMYHLGDEISLLRLYTPGELELSDVGFDYNTGVQREQAQVRIGAILGYDAFEPLYELGVRTANIGTLLTARDGITQLGISTAGYFSLGARISGSPDDTTHSYLTDAFKGIAARGDGMELVNNMQVARDFAAWQTIFRFSLLAVTLLLLFMCLNMVNGSVTNRIRSEKRVIGTLRAVGATLQDVILSYRLQVLVMIGWGAIFGILLSVAYSAWISLNENLSMDTSAFGVPFGGMMLIQVGFLGMVALLCGINLSARIREIAKDSIVQNIREL